MSGRIVDIAAPGAPVPAVATLLAALNAFTAPRALRHWQRMALEQQGLELASPLDGTRLACDATLWAPHMLFAYRFPRPGGALWLVTGGCKGGWEIIGLALTPPGLGFATGSENMALLHHMLPLIGATLPPEGAAGFRAVVGHDNFAHHLWNELPGVAAASGLGAADLLVLHEPVLPLEHLVDWPGALVRVAEEAVRPADGRLLAGMVLPLGSTRLPAAVAARVRQACAVRDVVPPGRPGTAALSLSLRTMYRHPVNQLDFCRALLSRLPPTVDVYLDGFALPDDIDAPGRYDAAKFRGWQRDTAALAQALIDGAAANQPRLIDATQLSVPQAIALGARMDAYLAPHGTQQHKIGWLHPVPGLVHTSPHIAQWDQAAWLRDQCEQHADVAYLPAAMTATVPGQGAMAGIEWYDDYRFVDVADAADYASRHLAPLLAR